MAGSSHAQPTNPPLAVVELFTSQGCSSCPPADKMLGQLAGNSAILALSLPVTYWDYLGWRDTLASPLFTQRQRAYAKARGDGDVYTPQMIINGLQHCVGSQLHEIERKIAATASMVKAAHVPVRIWREGGRVLVEAGAAPENSPWKSGQVLIGGVKKAVQVPIARGENSGRTVTYYNVVRKLVEGGAWQGAPTIYRVPVEAFSPKDTDFIVVLLQAEGQRAIIGAARFEG
jgi:hypothetical protein